MFNEGNHARAAEVLEKIGSAAAGNPLVPFYLGICRVLTGQFEEGIETLRTALQTRGVLGSNRYRYYLGHALLLVGRSEESKDLWEAAAANGGPFSEEARTSLKDLVASAQTELDGDSETQAVSAAPVDSPAAPPEPAEAAITTVDAEAATSAAESPGRATEPADVVPEAEWESGTADAENGDILSAADDATDPARSAE
jgi:tetratricopeptide (TPR) repeat protein